MAKYLIAQFCFFSFSLVGLIAATKSSYAAPSWSFSRATSGECQGPFQFFDNRILIQAQLNGKGPFTLIFDTGGSNILTPEVAKQLGVALKPSDPVSGAGALKVPTWITRLDKVSIGDLVGLDQEFLVLSLAQIKTAFNFEHLDGIVGYEILQKMVTRIDYKAGLLKFSLPSKSKQYEMGAVVLPIEFDGEHPVVESRINSIPSKIMIDTGDRSAFTVYRKFAEKSGLKKMYYGKPEILSGYGVGGPIPAQIAHLPSLTLGSDLELRNVLSRLPNTKSGVFAKSELSGSVGNELLRRFTVTFDYPGKKVALVRNDLFESPYLFHAVPNPMRESAEHTK